MPPPLIGAQVLPHRGQHRVCKLAGLSRRALHLPGILEIGTY
jgi:hypothetical protein